jgi:hypothetical protein
MTAIAWLSLSGSAFATTPALVRVSAPRGTASDALRSVSFAAAGKGWAVGSTGVSLEGTGVDRLLLEWNGAQWRKVAIDAVANSNEDLRSVAAVSTTDAWAVGGQNPYGINDDLPVLLHYSGARWSPAKGAITIGMLWSVAASAATNVWALGTGLERYDGNAWQLVAFRDPAGLNVRRAAVATTSPNDVWIAGTSFVRTYGGAGKAMIEHWNGSSWQLASLPATGNDRLMGIATRSPSDVWAVGSSDGAPLALHYDGATWKRVAAAPTNNGGFEAVAIDGAGTAWAVGHEDGVDSRDYAVWRPMVQRFTGSAWQPAKTPTVGDYDAWLGGVTIVGGVTWAVGAHQGTLVARGPA